MRAEEDDESELVHGSSPYVDGAWGRTANPNTADGELQNMAAFSAGFGRLTGGKRTAAKAVVWLILLGFALTALFLIIAIAKTW